MISQDAINDILQELYSDNPALTPQKNIRYLAQILNTTTDDPVVLLLAITLTSTQEVANEIRYIRRERNESYGTSDKALEMAQEVLSASKIISGNMEDLTENILKRFDLISSECVNNVQQQAQEAIDEMRKETLNIQKIGEQLRNDLEVINKNISQVANQWTYDLSPLVERIASRSAFRANIIGWSVIFIFGCLGVSLCAFFIFFFIMKFGVFVH